MADQWLEIKRGSTSPFLEITLTGAAGPVDLSTASTVHLTGRKDGTNTISVDLPARPTDGVLTYQWAPGDLASIGLWRFQVDVTAGGKVTKYPTVRVEVVDSLTP